MKIILFSRSQLHHTPRELNQLFEALELFGFDFRLNEEFAPVVEKLLGREIPAGKIYGQRLTEKCEDAIMVCYGGDGTLLEGIHRLGGQPVPVLGINAGHLGFLTSAPTAGLNKIFEEIAARSLRIEERSMLEVCGDFPEQPFRHLALNEFTVQRKGAGMISVETFVNGQMVATYHGDGVIVSTPTGSTAYSLSAGGPVVAPGCACFVITPLAPHNLTMRPVVVPDSATITMRVDTRRSDSFITFDDRSHAIAHNTTFTLRKAPQKILLALPHNISFYDTLRDKMMWGVDIRS